jgi:hypothetical protein
MESGRRACCLTEGGRPLLKLDEGTPGGAAARRRKAVGEDGCLRAEVEGWRGAGPSEEEGLTAAAASASARSRDGSTESRCSVR